MKQVFVILLLTLTLTACKEDSDSPETLAGEACACVKNQMFGLMSGEINEKDMPACARDIIEKLRTAIDEREPEERSEYVRQLLIAALETDCAVMMFRLAPVEKMLKEYLPEDVSGNN